MSRKMRELVRQYRRQRERERRERERARKFWAKLLLPCELPFLLSRPAKAGGRRMSERKDIEGNAVVLAAVAFLVMLLLSFIVGLCTVIVANTLLSSNVPLFSWRTLCVGIAIVVLIAILKGGE